MTRANVIIGALALVLPAGCGDPALNIIKPVEDDDQPRARAALFIDAHSAPGAACSLERVFEIPAGAFETLDAPEGGARIVDGDGDQRVACSVQPLPAPASGFAVVLELRSAPLGQFHAEGVVTPYQDSILEIEFAGLRQQDCVARSELVKSGAVWLRSVTCLHLRDPAAGDFQCSAELALLFELCGG